MQEGVGLSKHRTARWKCLSNVVDEEGERGRGRLNRHTVRGFGRGSATFGPPAAAAAAAVAPRAVLVGLTFLLSLFGILPPQHTL